MVITFHRTKRDKALKERGLDFAAADAVFSGRRKTFVDDRRDYGEERLVTAGFLADRMVVVCWTLRGDDRHVFSMRKANAREQKKYPPYLS